MGQLSKEGAGNVEMIAYGNIAKRFQELIVNNNLEQRRKRKYLKKHGDAVYMQQAANQLSS